MRFLIDSMLPPVVKEFLIAAGHEAVTPADLGAHNLPDDHLVEIAAREEWVIVTENAADFSRVSDCPVLFVRKSWWPTAGLAPRMAAALGRWAAAHPDPGPWPHWLPTDLR